MSLHRSVVSAVLLAVSLAIPGAAQADYDPPQLHELFGRAEVIVRGRIVELHKATYLLEVDECLAGEGLREAIASS